jgi:hypothetical protein
MTRRLAASLTVFALLGFLAGLADLRQLLQLLSERTAGLSPLPTSVLWSDNWVAFARLLDAAAVPLRALAVALSVGALWLLGTLLHPGFRLTKPPAEQPGRGFTAHLEVPRLLRAGGAVFLTLWVLGALGFVAALLSGKGRPIATAYLVLGGLPYWVSPLPFALGLALHSLGAAVLVWWLWGPRGPVAAAPGYSIRGVLSAATLAGAAASPAVLALHGGRTWAIQAGLAHSLVDASGWARLMAITVASPALFGAWLALVAAVCRPAPSGGDRREQQRVPLPALLLAVAGTGLALGCGSYTAGVLQRLDVNTPALAARLGLRSSPLSRFAMLLAPRGGYAASTVPDNSDDGEGGDVVAADGKTVEAVTLYLEERQYRTALAPRAYEHLVAVASLDWLTHRSMALSLQMMERFPTRLAGRLLQEKLEDCPTSPENRKLLDALADPRRFSWSASEDRRWLGAIFLRFGDRGRALEYLRDAGLTRSELRSAFGGLGLQTAGVVRGQLLIEGRPVEGVRFGMVRVEKSRRMIGLGRALDWRHVSDLAHTDNAGRFEFRNVAEGAYILALTGGGIVPGRGATIAPHPGMLIITQESPLIELPRMNLTFQRPPPAPLPAGPRPEEGVAAVPGPSRVGSRYQP